MLKYQDLCLVVLTDIQFSKPTTVPGRNSNTLLKVLVRPIALETLVRPTWHTHFAKTWLSSKFGRVPTSRYQAAFDFQKMLRSGKTGGASSRVPAGTRTLSPLRVSQGNLEPHIVQKELQKRSASGCCQRLTNSSPCVQVNCSRLNKILAACAAPDVFLHRLQWQYWKNWNGGVISYATLPQAHVPPRLLSVIELVPKYQFMWFLVGLR